jgi:hypothetical protein
MDMTSIVIWYLVVGVAVALTTIRNEREDPEHPLNKRSVFLVSLLPLILFWPVVFGYSVAILFKSFMMKKENEGKFPF